MSRRNTEAHEEFTCIGTCEDPPCWLVEGRFNAEGEFEATDDYSIECPECGDRGEPTDSSTVVSDR